MPGGWSAWITPATPAGAIQFGFGNSYYGAAVFEDPQWDFRTLDFDRDVRIGDAKAGPILNATTPDLRSFRAGGGKLIQYHGWGDAAIPAPSSIEYYESVRAFFARYPDARTTGTPPVDDFYRLFMVPGMGALRRRRRAEQLRERRRGGPAPIRSTTCSSLSSGGWNAASLRTGWSERARRRTIPRRRSRGRCVAYPNRAQYRGTGNVNDAANFICAP